MMPDPVRADLGWGNGEADRVVVGLILEWADLFEVGQVFAMGIDALFLVGPRDIGTDFTRVCLDTGIELAIPSDLYGRTMAYVFGPRQRMLDGVVRQAVFLDRHGQRFTMSAFLKVVRTLLAQPPFSEDAAGPPATAGGRV